MNSCTIDYVVCFRSNIKIDMKEIRNDIYAAIPCDKYWKKSYCFVPYDDVACLIKSSANATVSALFRFGAKRFLIFSTISAEFLPSKHLKLLPLHVISTTVQKVSTCV